MTETCGGSVSDIGSIHASQSDYSITNSSPRLESNASSACTELRRDFGTELICAICGELFNRPVMVSCGHSFCEACIEVHCRTSRNCVICDKDVGDFSNMIPSITLENIVNKMKSQDIVNSLDDLFIYDDSGIKSKIERSLSTRSKKRCFFTIAAPTICSSPVTEKRKMPVLSHAKPSKSALKYPTCYPIGEHSSIVADDFSDEADGERIISGHSSFARNGYGRRSERYTSATRDKSEDVSKISKVANQSAMIEPDKLKRNSLFRRSLNAFRSKTGRRSFSDAKEEAHEDSQILLNNTAPSVEGQGSSSKSSSVGKSLWRRLFVSRKVSNNKIQQICSTNDSVTLLSCQSKRKDIVGFSRLEEHEEDAEREERIEKSIYGFYIGIGKKFEKRKMGGSQEISVVVFGPSQTGKSLFVKELRRLFSISDDSSNIELIPITKRYEMAGLKDTPYPEGDNRLPHVVSFMIRFDDGTSTLIDVIDPEYDSSYLPESYMRICDAALFLIDNKNCGTVLTAYQIFRNMRNDEKKCMVECDMIVNCRVDATGQMEKVANSAVCENFARTMKANVYEMNVQQLEKTCAEKMLMSLAKRVIDSRVVANSLGTAV